ncbi:TonB-dependent receptor [Pelomonas sp. SE-A7]|uniref:TonB-dependent receptor n=1 Tax=Pelomonas sp. SE-A7 TaxID=3054953 RepID=UPI00259CC421|nr:TonB-dependent receptor [Pelomonas sp. SE-A7]MDM4766851.1 TonB-dependent receptor [Pelomonas sp. SE-A7]
MKRQILAASTLFALTAGALCVSGAWAQGAPAAEPAAADAGAAKTGDEAKKLETVVVTSQRREMVITKVPMSVAAITSAALEKQSIRDVSDISHATPGLTLSSPDPSGESNISIRGISSIIGASTTGLYIDDLPIQIFNIVNCPISCGGDTHPKLFDVDRVEVLRGPQGTLYGASSEGGAVRFITAQPKLSGQLSGRLHAEVSAWQKGAPSEELGVVLDTPLATDVAGMRLSLWQQHEGGYLNAYSPTSRALTERNVNSSDSQVARIAFRLVPTDRLSITPSYFYQNVKQADRASFVESLGVDKTLANMRQPKHDRFGIGAVSADYDFDSFAMKTVVSNLHRIEDRIDDTSNLGEGRLYLNYPSLVPAQFPFSALAVPLPSKDGMANSRSVTRNTQNTWTAELRLTSTDRPDSQLSWIAGAYFQRAKQSYKLAIEENVPLLSSMYDVLWGGGGTLYAPSNPLGNQLSYTEFDHFNSSQQALFGESSYKITPKLTSSVGLRMTRVTTSFDNALDGWWAGGPNYFSGSNKESPVTPKFGLSYQASADTLVYATAAKGFRQGGANPSLAANPTCQADLNALGGANVEPPLYKSDSVWSYELGSKQTLADGAARLSGSLFWINWSDVQTQVALPTCGFAYIANMATATSKGFDLSLQAKASAAVTLSATLGYTHATYTKSVDNAGYAKGLSSVPYLVKAGDPLPTPRWTSTLGIEYGWQWAGAGPAYARADYQFATGYYRTGSQGTQGYEPSTRDVNALHMLNLRAGLRAGDWDYSLFVKNALNNRTEMSRFDSYRRSVITGGPSTFFYGMALAPRMFGASASYKF